MDAMFNGICVLLGNITWFLKHCKRYGTVYWQLNPFPSSREIPNPNLGFSFKEEFQPHQKTDFEKQVSD